MKQRRPLSWAGAFDYPYANHASHNPGDEWVFGAWLAQEPDWRRKACEIFGSLSPGSAGD